tara:strand:- start:2549 stop:3547 length:999 start_codon:yes stop_codon:yes gene_type:complete
MNKKNLRQLIREEIHKLMTEKKFDWNSAGKVDTLISNPSGAGGSESTPLINRLTQQSIETAPKRDGEIVGGLSGKEIMASTPSGYYYHGSHMPNLKKDNVKLFSKASDFGNSKIGDRYGFYITSNIGGAFSYSSTWVDESIKIRKEGEAIVVAMREKSLKKEGKYLDDNIYGAPYSLVEDFAREQGFDDADIYKFRDNGNEYWSFYSVLAAVKRGFWPSIYKIKLRPEDVFIPKLDLDITSDEVRKYTKNGVVGIYNGKLGGNEHDKRDEVAILNRHAIASMDKVDDATYFKAKEKHYKKIESVMGGKPANKRDELAEWMFAKELLSKYGGY